MWSAVLAIATLAVVFGLLLGYSAMRFRVQGDPIADQIDALLPQTQCGQCGHPGCRPYAESIAKGEDNIDKCLPGGEATALALADLLGRDAVTVSAEKQQPAVAVIDPQSCIGCTLCLQSCPVDAIVGAARQLHGVLATECTGCGLCLPPCPVQCIRMVTMSEDIPHWRWPYPVTRSADAQSAAPMREAA
jgi:Na+-translocating ferredoxin:NAD+ oxidoreductase subunit B